MPLYKITIFRYWKQILHIWLQKIDGYRQIHTRSLQNRFAYIIRKKLISNAEILEIKSDVAKKNKDKPFEITQNVPVNVFFRKVGRPRGTNKQLSKSKNYIGTENGDNIFYSFKIYFCRYCSNILTEKRSLTSMVFVT